MRETPSLRDGVLGLMTCQASMDSMDTMDAMEQKAPKDLELFKDQLGFFEKWF